MIHYTTFLKLDDITRIRCLNVNNNSSFVVSVRLQYDPQILVPFPQNVSLWLFKRTVLYCTVLHCTVLHCSARNIIIDIPNFLTYIFYVKCYCTVTNIFSSLFMTLIIVWSNDGMSLLHDDGNIVGSLLLISEVMTYTHDLTFLQYLSQKLIVTV